LCLADQLDASKCQKDRHDLHDRTISATEEYVLYSHFEPRSGRLPKIAQSWHSQTQIGDTLCLAPDADLEAPYASRAELAYPLRERLEPYRPTNGPTLSPYHKCRRLRSCGVFEGERRSATLQKSK